MKRSKALKLGKARLRSMADKFHDWEEGHLSFGKLAELISESLLREFEEVGLRPPIKSIKNSTCEDICAADDHIVDSSWEPEKD